MKNHSDIILNYHVVFEEQPEGGYTVTVPALPGCITEGDTFEEARRNANEAITVHLESMLKDGLELPSDTSVIVESVSISNKALNIAF